MTPEKLEKLRHEAAIQIHRGNMALRSCWKCNRMHEHLKRVEYVINCFACGRYFYKGVDITSG